MLTITDNRPARGTAQDSKTLTAPSTMFAKPLLLGAAPGIAPELAWPETPGGLARAAQRRGHSTVRLLAAWRARRPRGQRALVLFAGLAALIPANGLAQPVPTFKLEMTTFYVQGAVMVNPPSGSHFFANPPAGPGLWCTPAELILNGIESVTARDYPLCPGANGILQRTRHDSAPHAGDVVPSNPWQFDITCPVPNPGPGARATRITGVRTHPNLNHVDRYSAVVGAYLGTVPGPSKAPRFAIMHGSMGIHTIPQPPPGTNPPPPAPIIFGGTLEPPSGRPSRGDEDYPVGEVLTMADPATGRLLLLLVLEGVSQTNLGSVYVRDGAGGPILTDLRPLLQTRELDTYSLALPVEDRAVPASVLQAMNSGNAYVEVRTTAHPDGKLVGALTAVSSTSSYEVQLQPGWNVIANQLARGSNTLGEVLPSVPPGSVFYHWDVNTQSYVVSSFDPELGGWDNPTLPLPPGDGGFILNPSQTSFIHTFVGETIASHPLDLPAGFLVLAARQTPEPGGYPEITGQPPTEGTGLYRYDAARRGDPSNLTNWQAYTFSGGAWTPGTPSVGVGEPVFIQVPATLKAPAILMQPQSQAVAAGTDVSFTVQATGMAPLAYQWYFGGQPVPVATDATLSLTHVQSAQAGAYRVTVTNASGSVSSDPAQLLVNNPPVLEPIAPMVVHQGERVFHLVTATDPDGHRVYYELETDAPPGMVIDRALGLVTWDTTTVPALTTHEFTVRVMDNGSPPLSATRTGLVVVVAPLRIQEVARGDGEVRITWNSIAGREYIVRATADLSHALADWDYRAATVAESGTTTWVGFLDTETPTSFYTVTTTCADSCNCTNMQIQSLTPNHGKGVSFSFETVNLGSDGTVAKSATLEVPFTIKGTITCDNGTNGCHGSLEMSVPTATCEIIDATGARLLGPISASPVNVVGNDPKGKDWKEVAGECGKETPFSPEVKCVATFDFTGQKGAPRKKLITDPPTAWVRATFTFQIRTKCNGVTGETRTFTMTVDGRADDPANGRLGRFDREASDLDGDKKLGKDEKDADAKDFHQRYKNDLDRTK